MDHQLVSCRAVLALVLPVNLVTNTNTSETFCTIQAAIDDAQTVNGNTLSVGAGTYIENVVVNKSVTISGPNAASDTCNGVLLPQAIIIPATGGASTGLAATSVVSVIAPNVTITGLTINGDNPSITSPYAVGLINPDVDMAIFC